MNASLVIVPTTSTAKIEPITQAMSIANTKSSNKKVTNHIENLEHQPDNKLLENNSSQTNKRLYRYTKKPRKQLAPRTWRTRPDPFESVSYTIRIQLELNPARTAKSLLDNLIKDSSDKFNIGNLRTLQNRTAQWRKEQIKINQERYSQNALTQNNVINNLTRLNGSLSGLRPVISLSTLN